MGSHRDRRSSPSSPRTLARGLLHKCVARAHALNRSTAEPGRAGGACMTRRRIVLSVIALGVIAFFVVSWRSPIRPRSAPTTFPPGQIGKGQILAAEGHCASCHTAPGGEPYAGGYAMKTPFGTIYGTNITPDPETGIGLYSLAAFTRAMREGIRRDGAHLFPAFPYYAFTRLTNEDVGALYAYLMSRPPVRADVPKDTLRFPLSIRAFQSGWKLLFFRPG